MQERRTWHKIFDVMKTQDLQSRLLHPAKLSFGVKGQIKSFPDNKKLMEFTITKPVLEEMKRFL